MPVTEPLRSVLFFESCRKRQGSTSLAILPIRYCGGQNSTEFFNPMSSQLPNYLRAQRKRLSLSQDEVAFLLGAESGAKVCRYERFTREPSLRTALACEAVFHKPVRELFAGLYATVEREVESRAKILARKPKSKKSNCSLFNKQAASSAFSKRQPPFKQS